jgi:hypothetical protein
MSFGIISLTLTIITVLYLSYTVAHKHLYQGFDNNNRCSMITFVTVMTSSIGLLLMIVVEIMGAYNVTFRIKMFIIVIGTLNYSMLFIVPLLIIYKSILKLTSSMHFPNFVLVGCSYLAVVLFFLLKEVCSINKIEPTLYNMISFSVYVVKPDC